MMYPGVTIPHEKGRAAFRLSPWTELRHPDFSARDGLVRPIGKIQPEI